jgi:HAD superfamily hydrolase (TIGR01509 family)
VKPPDLRGVILDMDGVIVDSEPLMKEACVRLFAEKGQTVFPDDFNPFIGTGEDRMLGGVAEKYGITLDLHKDKARTYAIYLDLIPGRLHALPGVFSFIEACQKRRLKLALASSADSIKVQGNLRAIGLSAATFNALVNGSEVTRKKPFPDIFLKAAEELQLKPVDCLVVEDAVAGVQAAKSAGSLCLALTTSFPADRLTAADWIATDLSQVPNGIFS